MPSVAAVVTVMEEHENFARTVHFLRRGDSFGVGTINKTNSPVNAVK